MDDDLEGEPACSRCGTVMYVTDGAYLCRGCGHEVGIPWAQFPGDGGVGSGPWA